MTNYLYDLLIHAKTSSPNFGLAIYSAQDFSFKTPISSGDVMQLFNSIDGLPVYSEPVEIRYVAGSDKNPLIFLSTTCRKEDLPRLEEFIKDYNLKCLDKNFCLDNTLSSLWSEDKAF